MMVYVIFRESSHPGKEIYLSRGVDGDFVPVPYPDLTNLRFETAREGYDFAGMFPTLESWRVGIR